MSGSTGAGIYVNGDGELSDSPCAGGCYVNGPPPEYTGTYVPPGWNGGQQQGWIAGSGEDSVSPAASGMELDPLGLWLIRQIGIPYGVRPRGMRDNLSVSNKSQAYNVYVYEVVDMFGVSVGPGVEVTELSLNLMGTELTTDAITSAFTDINGEFGDMIGFRDGPFDGRFEMFLNAQSFSVDGGLSYFSTIVAQRVSLESATEFGLLPSWSSSLPNTQAGCSGPGIPCRLQGTGLPSGHRTGLASHTPGGPAMQANAYQYNYTVVDVNGDLIVGGLVTEWLQDANSPDAPWKQGDTFLESMFGRFTDNVGFGPLADSFYLNQAFAVQLGGINYALTTQNTMLGISAGQGNVYVNVKNTVP